MRDNTQSHSFWSQTIPAFSRMIWAFSPSSHDTIFKFHVTSLNHKPLNQVTFNMQVPAEFLTNWEPKDNCSCVYTGWALLTDCEGSVAHNTQQPAYSQLCRHRIFTLWTLSCGIYKFFYWLVINFLRGRLSILYYLLILSLFVVVVWTWRKDFSWYREPLMKWSIKHLWAGWKQETVASVLRTHHGYCLLTKITSLWWIPPHNLTEFLFQLWKWNVDLLASL